ncbi:hypothetical protein VP01_14552g1, partial [Puccinia sorghi]
MAKDVNHALPERPSRKPPLTGLHILLKTILGDANNRNVSGAVTIPAGLVNVLFDMSLTAEKTMWRLEERINKLN